MTRQQFIGYRTSVVLRITDHLQPMQAGTPFSRSCSLLGKCIIFPTFVGANAPLLLLSSRSVVTLPARYPGFPMIFGSICSAGHRRHAVATLEVARSASVSILVQHASADLMLLWFGSADRHPCLLVCVDATSSSY